MSNLNFSRFEQEAYTYINHLAQELGHSEEKERSLILWRAVMHTLRDRIMVSESLDLISQLPVILRGIYTEQWKYHETPPLGYNSIEEMKTEVKRMQKRFGEDDFDWQKSTDELIAICIQSLSKYLDDGQMEHLRNQLPNAVNELVH